MCGRYGFGYSKVNEIYERWEIEDRDLDYKPSYNIAPTQTAPIITKHSPNKISLVKWGYMPKWMEGKKGMRALINARADGLIESKTFRKPLQYSRCIVPATFFFEWKKINDKEKLPYLIKLKKEKLFGFAGLICESDGEKAYVIITTEPNKIMESIHNRMPVILSKEDEEKWLNLDETDPEILVELLKPFDSSKMVAYPVSSLVNSPKNNFPEITKPL